LPLNNVIKFDQEVWDTSLNELQKLDQFYIPHRSPRRASKYWQEDDGREWNYNWDALTLYGPSSVHSETPSGYDLETPLTDAGYFSESHESDKWTDICDFCPTTVNIVKKIIKNENQYDGRSFKEADVHRVLILRIRPGGYILQHTDRQNGEEDNKLGVVNVAINNPEGNNFYQEGGGIIPFKQGSIIRLNNYYFHSVINNSNENRYHMQINASVSNLSYNSYIDYLNQSEQTDLTTD
jgi:hypothetical protein